VGAVHDGINRPIKLTGSQSCTDNVGTPIGGKISVAILNCSWTFSYLQRSATWTRHPVLHFPQLLIAGHLDGLVSCLLGPSHTACLAGPADPILPRLWRQCHGHRLSVRATHGTRTCSL
jgi:hypothetical protein